MQKFDSEHYVVFQQRVNQLQTSPAADSRYNRNATTSGNIDSPVSRYARRDFAGALGADLG